MRKLTIEECQQVELDIMKAIHSFCCERNLLIIAAEMLRRSRLRCCGVPRCAATR